MKYCNICEGKFIERPNRFVAYAEINGKTEKVHVKNTGRCRELLMPGVKIYLEDFSCCMGNRKLKYSLIAVEKDTPAGKLLINMDSQSPNKVVKEALLSGKLIPCGLKDADYVKAEHSFGNSRIDFYVRDSEGHEALIEVKGVTLENRGTARFPDAPTERGIKHINELIKAADEGFHAGIIFVIQMKGPVLFTPNYATHPEFGDALKIAAKSGVHILAYDCITDKDTIELDQPVNIRL